MNKTQFLNKYLHWIPPGLLGVFTYLFYKPSLHYGYMFDDLPQISRNFYIKTLKVSDTFFSDTRWFVKLVNLLTFKVWQYDQYGYRLTNVFIHIATGLLMFAVLYFALRKSVSPLLQKYAPVIATITSGLFLLHPAQTQTATYITQMRHEGLVALFTFTILLLFIGATSVQNQILRYALYGSVWLLLPFSTGTKEIVIVLPLLLILFDWFCVAQGTWADFKVRIPFHIIGAVIFYSVYAHYVPPVPYSKIVTAQVETDNNRGNVLTPQKTDKISLKWYFITQFKVITHYLMIFFWPFYLSFDYDYKLSTSPFSPDVVFPFLFLLLLGLYALYLFVHNKANLLSFCIAWFFIALLPRASIVPTNELVCDYKTFLPSFGVFLAMALGIVWLWEYHISPARRSLGEGWEGFAQQLTGFQKTIILPLLFIPLGFATFKRNEVWSTPLAFWKDVTDKSPSKARAHNNYAVALAETGNHEGSIEHYLKAIECEPTYAEPRINLAFHYQAVKNRDLAHKYYVEAMNLSKGAHPEMYLNLGVFNLEGGDLDKAIRCFNIALSLRPYYSRAHFNLGRAYLMQKNHEKAAQCFKQALEGDLQSNELYYLAGESYYRARDWDKALEYLGPIESKHGNFKNTYFILGSCYYQKGNYPQAAKYFGECYQKNQNDPDLAYNYAQALLHSNEYAKAVPVFEQCCKESSKYVYAPLHLAKCRAHAGQKLVAKKELNEYAKKTTLAHVKTDIKALFKEIEVL